MKKIKFSVFYRLCDRKKFFEKLWNRESKKFSIDILEVLKMNLYETMEIIVVHILEGNKDSLKILLTRTDTFAKYSRAFFDYIMNTEIKSKNKTEVINIIDKCFDEDLYEENK